MIFFSKQLYNAAFEVGHSDNSSSHLFGLDDLRLSYDSLLELSIPERPDIFGVCLCPEKRYENPYRGGRYYTNWERVYLYHHKDIPFHTVVLPKYGDDMQYDELQVFEQAICKTVCDVAFHHPKSYPQADKLLEFILTYDEREKLVEKYIVPSFCLAKDRDDPFYNFYTHDNFYSYIDGILNLDPVHKEHFDALFFEVTQTDELNIGCLLNDGRCVDIMSLSLDELNYVIDKVKSKNIVQCADPFSIQNRSKVRIIYDKLCRDEANSIKRKSSKGHQLK